MHFTPISRAGPEIDLDAASRLHVFARRLTISQGNDAHVTAGAVRMIGQGTTRDGQLIGFLLGRPEPGDVIYLTGDFVWYKGTAEVGKRYRPKLIIAFAGSAQLRGRFRMTMDAKDVIEAPHAFPDATIVGVHNHGWAHFAESAEDRASAFATLRIAERLGKLEAGNPTRFVV